MRKYQTVAGDVWDLICYKQLGSTRWLEKLINVNRDKAATFVFKAGVELNLPDVSSPKVAALPPWRR